MEQARSLRPMGVGDLLDETFQIFRRNLRTFIGIAAVAMVPQMILQIGQLVIVGPVFFDLGRLMRGQPDPAEMLGATAFFFGSTIVISVAAALLYLLMMAAFTYAVAQRFLGEATGVNAAYRRGLSCFWQILGASVLAIVLLVLLGVALVALPSIVLALGGANSTTAGIVVIVAMFVWGIVAIYLGIRWTLIVPAIVLDQAGIRGSFSRSAALVKGSWWRVLAVLLVATLIYYFVATIPSMVIQLVLMGVGALISPNSFYNFMIASTAAASLFYIVAAPLLPTVTTLLYYDMRIRKEGFDLAMLADRLRP